MGLGNRHARRHDTHASRTAAGVQSSTVTDPSWDFQPGQRVMTCDGYPGVVASVEDGMLARNESYLVHLDNQMGQGHYSSGQLTDTVPDKHANLGSAAESYPELGSILVDRPDPAKVVVYASKTAGAFDYDPRDEYDPREAWEQKNPFTCSECGHPLNRRGESHEHHAPCEDPSCADDEPHVMEEHPDYVLSRSEGSKKTAGHVKTSRQVTAYEQGDEAGTHFDGDQCPECGKIIDSIHPDDDLDTHRAVEHGTGPSAEHDHRHSARTASSDPEAPRVENSVCASCGGPIYRTEDTDGWEHHDGDDDNHHASPNRHTSAYYTAEELRKAAEGVDAHDFGEPDVDDHGHLSWGGHSPACGDHPDDEYSMMGQNDATQRSAAKTAEVNTKGAPCLAKPGMVHPEGQCRCFTGGPAPEYGNRQRDYHFHGSFDPWSLLRTAAADADFGFEVTAAWSDVRNKAKTIRSEGRVHVTHATGGTIFAEVKGDHHVYETGLQRMPGKQAVSQWSCGCKWGAYHWGADDDMSRFAGRMCSHALALHYEAQSRGMFGQEVYSDDRKPKWAPRRVVVKYDINDRRDVSAPATAMPKAASALSGAVAHLRAAGEDRDELILALSAMGLRGRSVTASVNNAWGDPDQAEPTYLPGPTKPVNPNDNPASMGFASHADPDSWAQHGDSIGVYAELRSQADWNPLSYGTADAATPHQPQQPQQPKQQDQQPHLPHSLPRSSGDGGLPEAGEAAGAGEAAAGAGEAAAAGAGEAAAAGGVADLLPLLLLASGGEEDSLFEPPAGEASGAEATLHEEPEPALPSTDGSVADIVASFQATAAAQLVAPTGGSGGGAEIAEMVRATMAKEGMKEFSPAERQSIINEGGHVRARNVDKMDITGTHYEAMASDDDPDAWLA